MYTKDEIAKMRAWIKAIGASGRKLKTELSSVAQYKVAGIIQRASWTLDGIAKDMEHFNWRHEEREQREADEAEEAARENNPSVSP